MSSLMH